MNLKNNVVNILGAVPLGQPDSSRRQPTTKLVQSGLSRTQGIKRKKPRFYYFKVTQKGEFFEIFKSEKPVFYNFESIPKTGGEAILSQEHFEEVKKRNSEQAKLYRKRNAHRSKNIVIDLCLSNFTHNDKFLTLTFKDGLDFDVQNIKECNERYYLFIRRLRRFYKKLKYISVIEFQDKFNRGAIHYHLICNLPYTHWSKLKEIWSYGNIDIKRPRNILDVYVYIPKYFNKNAEDKRFIGHRTFVYSKNLIKPKVIVGSYAKALGEKIKAKFKVVGKPQEYISERHGKITKTLYTRSNSPALN